MNTRSRRWAWLIGLALGVLLTLMISPATRWLVRAQIAACGLTFRPPVFQEHDAEQTSRQAVAAHPDDLPLQMAAPHAVGGGQDQAAYLRTLIPRFPDSPSLYGNLLRYDIGDSDRPGSVYLSRREDWSLGSQPPPPDVKIPPPPSPAVLAAFDAQAAAGERLDPDNAYFPMMRAIGLFAGRRDAEAIAAVLRAGREPDWREYLQDDVNGRLRLADAAYGSGSALSRIAIAASILYPHYADLRGVARVATAKAAQEERDGQQEQGMALRRALMHCGSLMRADSSSYIGSLVGIAIAAIATARPGGAPPPGSDDHSSGDQRAQRRLQAFCAYATRIGHPEDARRAQSEAADVAVVKSIGRRGLDRSILGGSQMAHLGVWWISDLLTLANAFWLLVLGAAAAGVSRLPSVREQRPLPRPTLWGLAAALLTAALIALFVFTGGETQNSIASLSALVAAPAAGLIAVRLLRASSEDRRSWRRNTGQFVRAFLLTGLALAALVALAAWQARGVVGFFGALREVTGVSGGDNGQTSSVPQAQETEVAAVAGSLILPLLMLVALSIAGRVRRAPVSVALANGFRGGGPPIACLLLVVYGALALGTLRQERTMDDEMRRMVRHEGRYYASLAGQAWPAVSP